MKAAKRRRLKRKKQEWWVKPGRTDEWWLKMASGEAPVEFWRKNFRLTRTEFEEVVEELRGHTNPDPGSPNYRALSAETKIAIALYYLKDTGSLSMTANAFGFAMCTVSKVIFSVCQAITVVLGPKYFHLAKKDEEMRKNVAEIKSKFGIIQAFGYIDGTNVQIIRPSMNSQDFHLYKGFF